MALAPRPFYPKSGAECLIVLFNLRNPGAEERLRREQAAWQGSATIERLTASCIALIIRPGGLAA